MNNAGPLASPHTRQSSSVSAIMLQVWLALLPASLFGVWLYGWPALNLLLITTAAALAAEALGQRLAGRPIMPSLKDGSALLTGWILAMTRPPWAPWWVAVIGALFAIIIGKQVFGGLGQNLFNPAMLARVALLIAFPLELTTWVAPQPLFSANAPGFIDSLHITFVGVAPLVGGVDAISGATVLDGIKTELARGAELGVVLPDYYRAGDAMLGQMGGSLGETSALLLLLGGLYLIWRGHITWQIPAALLGTVALLATGFHLYDPLRFAHAGVHLLSGGLMLAAFFIATDPVGSPASRRGQLVFAAGIGALVYIIRTWGGFPEGVAFAVLLMNAATPLIDHYVRPRVYGRDPHGKPLDYQRGRFARRLKKQQGGE